MVTRIAGRVWGYLGATSALLAAVLGLTGCATTADEDFAKLPGYEHVATPSEMPEGEPVDPNKSDRVIDKDDTLILSFTDIQQPVPPLEQRVQDDGNIKLYYNEVFHAEGLKTDQLEQEIQKRYVPKIFARLTVTVQFRDTSRFYTIGGEVKSPGQKPYMGRIRVTQAIQAAGDFTEYASKRKIQLIHPDGRRQIVNFKKALNDPKLDPLVYPNDKIHVPRSWL